MPVDSSLPRPLTARLSAGVLALGGSMLMTRLLGLLNLAVLGRLLTPEDFGIVALAGLVTGAMTALLGRHFEIALIRTPDPDPAHIGSAFALSIIWGTATAIIVLLLAEWIAGILGEPEVATALRWLALIPLFEGLRNPAFSLYERQLSFRWPIIRDVSARLMTLFVSISLALAVGNYWAIVAGLIVYSATRSLVSHIAAPTAWPTLARYRDFLGFSGWMTVSSMAGYLNHRIDRAFVGVELGVAEAGRYRMGGDLAMMATSELTGPLLRVVYPGLVQRSQDLQTMRRAYRKAQGFILAVLLPAGVGVAVVAEDFLRVVVGAQWLGAAPILQVLAPLLALTGLTSGVHALIYIKGETRTLFLRDAAVLACLVPSLWMGIELAGLSGALAARVLSTGFGVALTLNIAARIVGERWWTPILAGGRTFAACAAMVVAVEALYTVLPSEADLLIASARLFLAAVSGAIVYSIAHLLLWRLVGAPDGPERDALGVLQHARRMVSSS